MKLLVCLNLFFLSSLVAAFVAKPSPIVRATSSSLQATPSRVGDEDRRAFLSTVVSTAGVFLAAPRPAEAIGPVKIALKPTKYKAAPCPPNKPIPGEKAMFGMRGLCVTVEADMIEGSPKDLEKVGVYGFVTDGETGNSVLANNPDLR